MLTFQQEKLLKFIIDYQKQNNVTPSFDEMKDGLDLKSKSGIHRIVSALEERGYIKKLNNRARAIEIIKNVNLIGLKWVFTETSPFPLKQFLIIQII